MALLKSDWSVAANGDIRSEANTTTHKVLELHRFLMDLFDDNTATGDDLLDVTGEIVPSTRSTDQIITLNSPYNIDDTAAERFYGGSFDQEGGSIQYSGLVVLGTLNGTTELQVVQNGAILTSHWGVGKNTDATKNILLQILVKSRDAGADIDGKRILTFAREWGDTYAEFPTTLGQAVSVAAVSTLADDFNTTIIGTIAAMAGISNVEGYQTIDLSNGNGAQPYYSQWNKDVNSTQELYERAKWLTRRGTASTLYGLSGDLFRGITHEFQVDVPSGTFNAVEEVTWATGSAQMLAIDSTTAATKMWVQLQTGVVPGDGDTITGTGSTASVTIDTNVTARTLGAVFIGSFTGALTGAYGVGVESADLINTDKLRDLLNVTQNPPNNVNITVLAVVSGDRLFASRVRTDANTVSGAHTIGVRVITTGSAVATTAPQPGRVVLDGVEHAYLSYTGSTITLAEDLKNTLTGGEAVDITSWLTDQYAAAAGNNTSDGTLVIGGSIEQENPAAGFVRIWNSTDSVFDRYEYSSFTGSTFTLVGTLSTNYDAADDVYVPFIDEDAVATSHTVTIVYPGGDIAGRLRVYNSAEPIVPFEVGITVGSAGSSTQAIRAADA